MMRKFHCDKCEKGKIVRFMHVDNGFCYKCNGTGKLSYNPAPKGKTEKNEEWSDVERMEIEAEQKMVAHAEMENWMYANNIEYDY